MTQPGLKSGPISADELVKKLAASRKIMNKVDSGDYEKGNINEGMLQSSPEEMIQDVNTPTTMPRHKSLGLPVGVPTPEKIRKSRLPDAIKTAMIENPIPVPEISLSEGLDITLINKAKKLMDEDNGSNKKGNMKRPTNPQDKKQLREEIDIPSSNSELEQIIESVIRRVLDEKLTQILTAQHMSTINENLAIKVGDSIFTGKITKVKSSK